MRTLWGGCAFASTPIFYQMCSRPYPRLPKSRASCAFAFASRIASLSLVPTLSYGCSIKDYSSREMRNFNTAVNNAIRRIFSYNRWETTRSLRENFGYPSLYETFSKAKDKFRLSIANHSNTVLSFLSTINITNQDEDELP